MDSTIAGLNADAKKPGGPERVLKSISASTHVPVATLEKGRTQFNLTYGDLFMAYSIARVSGKSFEEIAKSKAKGESWDKIADANNVGLDGKKKVKQSAAKPTPTPEQRTLAQEQRDRWSGKTERTNAPKPRP